MNQGYIDGYMHKQANPRLKLLTALGKKLKGVPAAISQGLDDVVNTSIPVGHGMQFYPVNPVTGAAAGLGAITGAKKLLLPTEPAKPAEPTPRSDASKELFGKRK